jgi:hypothetical protein
MMIMPPGQAQAARQPHAIRPREKAMLGGVLAAVAALLVVLVVSLATGEQRSGRGCISVGLAYSTGGARVDRCGSSAKAMCASVGQPGGATGVLARSLTTECRKAGLALG